MQESLTLAAPCSLHYIKQASFSEECKSLPPMRIFLLFRNAPAVALLASAEPVATGGAARPFPVPVSSVPDFWVGARDKGGAAVGRFAYTSTSHSYQTLRSSVLRHIVK